MKTSSGFEVTAFLAIVVFSIIFGVAWCSFNVTGPGDTQKKAVEAQGFTEVQIGDWAPASCADSDDVARHFTAKNVQGEPVAGVICCGLVLKACTIRW